MSLRYPVAGAVALALTLAVAGCGSGSADRPTPTTAGSSDSSAAARASASAAAKASASAAQQKVAAASAAASSKAAASRAAAAEASQSLAGLKVGLTGLLGSGDSYSAAAVDLTTGTTIQVGAGSGMTEASLVKLSFLETLLYQDQQDGDEPGAGHEDDLELMIEHSDNAAGQRIWYAVGDNAGVAAYNSVLGLTSTVLDPTGTWGLSTTSAADQLKLVRALVSSTSPLNAASRAYAMGLLGNVESDQKWGVSAAADKGAPTYSKNGWLNIDRDGGLWAVNSAGVTTVNGHRVLMVVLSQHQPDFQTGVSRVDAAAAKLGAILN